MPLIFFFKLIRLLALMVLNMCPLTDQLNIYFFFHGFLIYTYIFICTLLFDKVNQIVKEQKHIKKQPTSVKNKSSQSNRLSAGLLIHREILS